MAYGLSATIIGLAGLIDRSLLGPSSLGQTLNGPVDDVWLTFYAIGGVLAFTGVAALRPELETIGLYALLAAALINAAAIVANRGPIGGGVTVSGLLLGAWVIHRRIGDLHTAARADRRVLQQGPPDGRERRQP